MKLTTKVLIVGGGPAGATAAGVLAGAGLDVILLERNLSFVKPCGGGLSLNAFDEFCIPKTVIQKEVPCIRIISPKSEMLDIDLKGSSLAIIARGEFDNELRNKAKEKGANIIEAEFNSIMHNKNYRIEAAGSEWQYDISAEYVIASDGVNSRLRTALGIKPARSFFTMSEHIQGETVEFCEFWFGSTHAPRSYSWVFPTSEGISTGTGAFEQGQVKALFERFKERKGIKSEGNKRIYKVPIWEGDLYNKGKVIFAGDSAGHVLPLTYEGIYYAMKAGEFAARSIIEEKVGQYKKMWKARFLKRFILMERLRDYFLKNDYFAERLVALHRRPEIQEVSLRLWLSKDSSKEGLVNYIKLFRKFLS